MALQTFLNYSSVREAALHMVLIVSRTEVMAEELYFLRGIQYLWAPAVISGPREAQAKMPGKESETREAQAEEGEPVVQSF